MRVYLTRDRHSDGEMSTYVDIWDEKPFLIRNRDEPMGDIWVVHECDWLYAKVGMMTDVECHRLYGTKPDHFEQLILSPYRTPNKKAPRGIP